MWLWEGCENDLLQLLPQTDQEIERWLLETEVRQAQHTLNSQHHDSSKNTHPPQEQVPSHSIATRSRCSLKPLHLLYMVSVVRSKPFLYHLWNVSRCCLSICFSISSKLMAWLDIEADWTGVGCCWFSWFFVTHHPQRMLTSEGVLHVDARSYGYVSTDLVLLWTSHWWDTRTGRTGTLREQHWGTALRYSNLL